MSRTRQRFPDGPVTVRTYPVTFLSDRTERRLHADWHVLTYATRGHLEVVTEETRCIVPADRAVWIPAGTAHTAVMRAPIAMRTVFVAAAALPGTAPHDRVRTIAVAPLLRELVLHITGLGALDRRQPRQAHLIAVLLDLLTAAEDVTLALPAPRDARARRFAALVTRDPGDRRSIAELSRLSGASTRTLERRFLSETGVAVGEWRRRVRLFHAARLLASGQAVTSVADTVGYDSTSAFCQAYARQFGHSPGRRHGTGGAARRSRSLP